VTSCAAANSAPDGRKLQVAGVVLIRQRPGKGNAVFITIEDETGIANALLWSRDMEKQRRAVMSARLMVIEGEIQRSPEGVVHLMASRVLDQSALLASLDDHAGEGPGPQSSCSQASCSQGPPVLRKHPRNVRIIPRSRDFHRSDRAKQARRARGGGGQARRAGQEAERKAAALRQSM
jgi:error-prone DNA polymerase